MGQLCAASTGNEKATKCLLRWKKAQEWWYSLPPSEETKKCQSDLKNFPDKMQNTFAEENKLKQLYNRLIQQQENVISPLKEKLKQLQANRILHIFNSELSQSAAINRFAHFNRVNLDLSGNVEGRVSLNRRARMG